MCIYNMHLVLLRAAHQLVALRSNIYVVGASVSFFIPPTCVKMGARVLVCVYTPHPVLLRASCQLVALRKQRLSCQSVCFVLCIVSVHEWVPELSTVLLRAAHQLVALRKQHLCCWSICFILYPTYMYLCVNGYLELWCAYTPPLVLLRTACKLVVLRKQPSICFTLYPPTYARMVPPIHAYCSHFPKVRWDSILEGYTRDFM